MKKINKNHKLIKNLFQDKLKRYDVGELSEIGIVEQSMREQWKENAERVDPEIGEQIWSRIQKEYKMSARKRYLFQIRQPLIAACITMAFASSSKGFIFCTSEFFSSLGLARIFIDCHRFALTAAINADCVLSFR